MTGRLFGSVIFPPDDPSAVYDVPGFVYGCPLCFFIGYRGKIDETFSELIDGTLAPIDYTVYVQPKHGPTITTEQLSGDVSICVSSGHIYTREIEMDEINLERYKRVNSTTITIINEDLPYLELIYHDGVFYNLTASIITDVVAESLLVNLAKANHELKIARDDPNLYQAERVRFIKLMDEYVVPPGIKLDTQYGRTMVKAIVDSLKVPNNHNLRINKMNVDGSFGKIYMLPFVNDKFILKYQEFKDDFDRYMWDIEMANSTYIDYNLINNPTLPYPYTYSGYKCGKIGDIMSLTNPSCPSSSKGEEEVGVLLQEYVSAIGTLSNYVRSNPTTMAIPAIIEAAATLAEAHQGDTVKHHFMHLDSHGKNFLVVYCDQSRNCTTSADRTVNFGPYNYDFGKSGFKIYLIDYGFSHFLESGKRPAVNGDLRGFVFDDQLYPAFDLTILMRHVLSDAFSDFAWEYVNSMERIQRGYRHVREQYLRMLKITSVMIAEQIVALINERLEHEYLIAPKDYRGEKYAVQMRDIEVDNLSNNIINIYKRQRSLIDVQSFLIGYVDKFVDAVLSVPPDILVETSYNETAMLLTGYYVYKFVSVESRSSGVVDVENEQLIRRLYQTELNPLPDEILGQLGLSAPPDDLTGIPLYLWYLNEYGVKVPLRE